MQDVHDLGLMLDSRIPLLVIETYEEHRALDMLMRTGAGRKSNVFRWSITDGLSKLSFGPSIALTSEYQDPENLLQYIKELNHPGIFVLCDFHPFLSDNPKIIRLIKDIALNHYAVGHTLVFLSHKLDLPIELSRFSSRFELSLPSSEEIMVIIREEAKSWAHSAGASRVKTDNRTLQKLVSNLKGLTRSDVRRLARSAIIDDGAITETDLPEVNRNKFALMDMEGVLSYEFDTESFAQVGGLKNLKLWLSQREKTFRDSSGADSPKGIMLLGVQGAGKSLAAKAVAGLWGLPLLRLDFASLFNKFIGETERNLREALKLADTMSPCVLWLDEIEKGMHTAEGDSGPTKRLLGTLLTWMSERQSQVFLVATSNNISALPPELVRKGRFDEVFFVDLPKAEVREEIFRIHMIKRGLTTDGFNLAELAELSDGFSGAEIEQSVVSALYSQAGQSDEQEIGQNDIIAELRATNPLSTIMAEQIAQLKQWASGRTVQAD